MNLAPQVQFQLFGRPFWLAGLGTLEDGRSITSLAGPVAASFDSQVVDVPQVSLIGLDLLQDQSANPHLLSVRHSSLPGVEDHSTPKEKFVADIFCPETVNADLV